MNSRKSHSPRILHRARKAVRETNRSQARYHRPEIFTESAETGWLDTRQVRPFSPRGDTLRNCPFVSTICQRYESKRYRERFSAPMDLDRFTLDQRPWNARFLNVRSVLINWNFGSAEIMRRVIALLLQSTVSLKFLGFIYLFVYLFKI